MSEPVEDGYDSLKIHSFWDYQQDGDVTTSQIISTRDLICWAFQIARGMDYLASKNVIRLSD